MKTIFENITKPVLQLNQILIKEKEKKNLLEDNNNLIQITKENIQEIHTINMNSICNIGKHLFGISAYLIDYESYFIDLKDLTKKILKRIHNTLKNSKIDLPDIKKQSISKKPYILMETYNQIVLLLKKIHIKYTTLQYNIIIPDDMLKKIKQLEALCESITAISKTVNSNNIPELAGYLKYLLSFLSKYKKINGLLIDMVDDTAMQFNYDHCE